MIARTLAGLMGVIIAVALVVIALWALSESRTLIAKADNRPLALWAVRSAAVAALAGAQVLGLTLVVGIFYRRRDRIDDLARLGAGFVCTAALIGAIAMGIMSR